MTKHNPITILGSGPAGLTAALYTARADLKPLVIEGIQPGGQLTITTEVENYPGFPEGVLGPQLMDLFRAQAERFGTTFITDVVTKVNLNVSPFELYINEDVYTCDALIISTGATAKLLGLPSESLLMGYGISACATCDAWFFREKEIVVIGGGDTACEEAAYLTKFASKVTIIHRREELRASKIMQARVLKNPKIEFKWNCAVKEFVGTREKGLDGITLVNTQTGEEEFFKCQGAFLGIGHKPNSDLFKGVLKMDENGYLVCAPGSTHTNVEGVFACGDVQDHIYRQAITAAGSGCMAALDAERYLSGLE